MMSLKHAQSTFNHGTAIINRAKQLINKHPGIYIGNLINRLQVEIESLNTEEINQMLFQLFKDGYDFKRALIYPPNTVDPIYKQLKRFTILTKGLNEMDFEIFLAITELRKRGSLFNITRRVISQNTNYFERNVKYEIGILFKNKFLLAKPSDDEPKYLDLNWDFLNGWI